MGGLGGRGGSFIPTLGLDTGCPITLSILESLLGRPSTDSAEDGGEGALASLPLAFLLKMGSL